MSHTAHVRARYTILPRVLRRPAASAWARWLRKSASSSAGSANIQRLRATSADTPSFFDFERCRWKSRSVALRRSLRRTPLSPAASRCLRIVRRHLKPPSSLALPSSAGSPPPSSPWSAKLFALRFLVAALTDPAFSTSATAVAGTDLLRLRLEIAASTTASKPKGSAALWAPMPLASRMPMDFCMSRPPNVSRWTFRAGWSAKGLCSSLAFSRDPTTIRDDRRSISFSKRGRAASMPALGP
mmetsp:Transcript_13252/g.55553  ORF Transcript_13252/g.55553 Transcript_13252/m.55553 type:complete len:242 (-) Transcript_13252:2838-3563(-)